MFWNYGWNLLYAVVPWLISDRMLTCDIRGHSVQTPEWTVSVPGVRYLKQRTESVWPISQRAMEKRFEPWCKKAGARNMFGMLCVIGRLFKEVSFPLLQYRDTNISGGGEVKLHAFQLVISWRWVVSFKLWPFTHWIWRGLCNNIIKFQEVI